MNRPRLLLALTAALLAPPPQLGRQKAAPITEEEGLVLDRLWTLVLAGDVPIPAPPKR